MPASEHSTAKEAATPKPDTHKADPILDAVKASNAGFNNSRYTRQQLTYGGTRNIHRVDFLGEDQNWYQNFVLERRGKGLRVYDTIDKLLVEVAASPWGDHDYVKLVVIAVLALSFGAAVLYVVLVQPENKSLNVLTGLLGLTTGYLVGKKEK